MKNIEKIVIGTKNLHKIREIRYLLRLHSLPKEIIISDLTQYDNVVKVVEDGKTYEENSLKKAVIYSKQISECVLADDSGIEVESLGWSPGIYSSRFSGIEGDDEANNEKLLKELIARGCKTPQTRRARYVCVVTLANQKGEYIVGRGECYGYIAETPRGKNGFGYDPLFFFPSYNKTFGEVSEEMKHKVSHRSLAIKKLVDSLCNVSR